MTPYLLDVNLLLALSDPMHVHHELAHQWFADKGQEAWATCPITENGFVRIASHPKYPNRPGDVQTVTTLLRQFCAHKGHVFWADDISLLDWLDPTVSITHNHITDLYLVALAIHHAGKLATLDRHIPLHAVQNGQAVIELIE